MKITTKRQLFLHIIGGVLFFGQPIWLPTAPPEEKHWLLANPTIRDFMANGMMLVFFYLNYFVLIPKLYFRNKHVLYVLVIITGLLLICLLPSIFTGRDPLRMSANRFPPITRGHAMEDRGRPNGVPPQGLNDGGFFQEIKHHVFLFVAVIFFSLMLQVRNRLLKAESARHQAELASLKAQINPHFLFNTLNSIYALAVRKDDKAADAIINLSELMRYVIKDAKDNRIPLGKELDYIRNYIDLQKSRLGNTAIIDFSIQEEAGTGEIAPLILISFIENAFKYGVNPDMVSEIAIAIRADNNTLYLMVRNNKVAHSRDIFSSGIGIENTQERLHLLYPGKHLLRITENEETYLVNLTMELV
jgi:hypothetical protein